jgi:uncharacterized protein YndB with AHSA1/START domain
MPKRITVWVQFCGGSQLDLCWLHRGSGRLCRQTAGTCNPLEAERKRRRLERRLNRPARSKTRRAPRSRTIVQRTYSASADRVFRAWTDPEQILKWMSPRDGVSAEFAEIDLRVGGRYRIGFRTPNGLAVVGGVFLDVLAPRKLVYTWLWREPNEAPRAESLVTVEFRDTGSGTELLLTHEEPGTGH